MFEGDDFILRLIMAVLALINVSLGLFSVIFYSDSLSVRKLSYALLVITVAYLTVRQV